MVQIRYCNRCTAFPYPLKRILLRGFSEGPESRASDGTLLVAIGPMHIEQYNEDKDATYCADAKESGIEVILQDPRKDSQNTSNSTSRGDNVNNPTPEIGCALIHSSGMGPQT